MSAPRISAVNALLPAPSPTARAPGVQVARTSLASDGSERTGRDLSQVFVMEHEDMIVSLAPGAVPGELPSQDLTPGDVLLVKVLSTTPRLALERLGQASPAAPMASSSRGLPLSQQSSAAMTPDQTAMLRMAWASPDAASLATSWRVLVLEHLRQLNGGAHLAPLNLAASAHPPSDQLATQPCNMPSMWQALERCLFPIQAWTGLPMSLHLLAPRHQGPRQSKARKRSSGWGLRISGFLPGLGRIELQTQLSSEGASLLIMAEDERTWLRLKDAVPSLSKAVTRAGWRLRACQVLQDSPAEDVATPILMNDGMGGPHIANGLSLAPAASSNASALPQALFRVTAEVLITLGTLGTSLNPRYR